jgi:hypothetical protein
MAAEQVVAAAAERHHLVVVAMYGPQVKIIRNKELWRRVQRIVYPRREPSSGTPYSRRCEMGPKKKPASWLYWLLLDNPTLRRQVLS